MGKAWFRWLTGREAATGFKGCHTVWLLGHARHASPPRCACCCCCRLGAWSICIASPPRSSDSGNACRAAAAAPPSLVHSRRCCCCFLGVGAVPPSRCCCRALPLGMTMEAGQRGTSATACAVTAALSTPRPSCIVPVRSLHQNVDQIRIDDLLAVTTVWTGWSGMLGAALLLLQTTHDLCGACVACGKGVEVGGWWRTFGVAASLPRL